ncbi:MAG: hypothetical protein E6J20_20685, partial [Chloroflexi bacterium]
MTIPTSRVFVCSVVAAFLLAGCGSASHHSAPKTPPPVTTSAAPPPPPSAPVLPGFLSVYPSAAQPLAAYFIQWQRTGSTVTGTLSVSYRDTQSGATGTSTSFTGTISGQSVGLDFGDKRDNGTLRDNQLTLAFAASDGSLQTLVFTPATVADYNAAVANVKAGGFVQGRQQAQAQADAKARQTTNADVSTVASDIQNLGGSPTSAQSDLASMVSDLKHERGDLAKTLSDKQSVLAEAAKYPRGNNGQVCYDASGVDYDASGVSYDENGVSGYDTDSITNDLNSLASDSATLNSDFQKFRADQAALPSYRAPGTPTAAIVNQALSLASSAASQSRRTMASYIAQAKQLLRTANAYDAEAQAACKKV